MSCYKYNGIILQEEELISRIKDALDNNEELKALAAVIYKFNDPVEILDKLKEEGEKAQSTQKHNPKTYISTTSFITAEHIVGGKSLLQDGNRLTAEYKEEERKKRYIEEHKDDPLYKGDLKLVAEAYDELVNLEKLNSKVGDYIHKFVHLLLTTKAHSDEYKLLVKELDDELKAEDYKFAKTITQGDPKAKHDDLKSIEEKIIDQAKNIVAWIDSKDGWRPNLRKAIYSELPMLLKKSAGTRLMCNVDGEQRDPDGLLGIADLIIVDKDNKIHLIDYKVCSREYNQWYAAKKNEVDYQLAIYRAILTLAGLNGDNITMTIKPVLFPKFNINLIEPLEEINALSSSTSYDRIAFRGGKFTNRLLLLGIGQSPVYIPENITDLKLEINNDYDAIMGFHKDPRLISKESLISNEKVLPDKDSQGRIIGYKFWSKFQGTHGGWIKAKTKEEFTKDGGILDLYISDMQESRNNIVKTIIDEIKLYKNNPEKVQSFLKSGNNPERAALLRRFLGKYTSAEWMDPIEIPELLDKGILLFRKIGTVPEIIDVVTLAEFDLDDRVLINGNQTILGKYYTDDQSHHLSIQPMPSLYRNVKALEAITALNTLLRKDSGFFGNAQIGNFIVVNPNGKADDNLGIDISLLKDNFGLLCSEKNGNIENAFKSVKVPTTYEYCMSELQSVLTCLGEDNDLNQLLSDIDNGTTTLALKRKRVAQLIQVMRNKYSKLRTVEFGEHKFDLNDPIDLCYVILSQMNNYLNGIRVDFDGRIAKWGIGLGELFSLLGVPITGKVATTDTEGNKISGFAGGMELTSPRTTTSNTLRLLNAYYDLAYQNVRKKFLEETTYISNLTKNYVKNFTSDFKQFFTSENTSIWERLLEHNGDKLNPLMIIKNPYDKSNDLTELDRQFLKRYLWEVNKYRIKNSSLDRSWHYDEHENAIISSDEFIEITSNNDSLYFQLPLARSGSFQRTMHLVDFGLKNWFEAKWKDFEETYDPRALHNERRKLIKLNDITEMYNAYDIKLSDRSNLIDSVKSPYDFQLDFDFLALDVAFNTIRKEHFDGALMLTETTLSMMLLQLQQSGNDMSDEIKVGRTLAKITLTGESTLDRELEKPAKGLAVVRQINSFALLACRPLMFIKELTFGMFTNFSRAWALKYGSNQLSFKTVEKANRIIWGQEFGKYGGVFTGDKSLADFTMCQQINRMYGIANEDLNRFVTNSSMSRIGKFNNMSKWMYIAQSAPDYFNRLTLFIAKMLEDGCFDAHTLDENGALKYDWKKDKRFDLLAKHGLNSDYNSPEYNKLKALYAKMCSEFEKGGEELIKWNPEKKKYEYGDLTSAYTADQKASIKEVSDMAYGFYDHETKSLINHKFFGLVFLLFQTFLSAKYNLWFKAPSTKGGNTAQGKFVLKERNGEKYYKRFNIDAQGNLIDVESIPESQLTEEEKRTLEPDMEWQGDFVEGLFYSIGYTLHDIFTMNWKEVANNKQRLANVMLAMHDILLGIVIFTILKAIFSDGTNKMGKVAPARRVLLRAMLDIGPEALTQVSITPSFVNTWTNMKTDSINLLFNGSLSAIDTMTKHFGATKDFIWED